MTLGARDLWSGDLKSGDLWAKEFFHHFLWLADKFPLDNFPPNNSPVIGNLSFLELVQGEIVFCGICPPGNMSTQELAQGVFPNPALEGRSETHQMTNIPQMLAVYIQ